MNSAHREVYSHAHAAFSYTADAAHAAVNRDVCARAAVNRDVCARAADMDMAAQVSRALVIEGDGDAKGAAALLRRRPLSAQPDLSVAAAAVYHDRAAEMEQGLSETQRKQSQEAAYRTRNSRA